MTHHYTRIPTVEELQPTIKPPLHESYWWFKGWHFNRPVIARLNIAGGIKGGVVSHWVRVEVGDLCPVGGYAASDFEGIKVELIGPIELPQEMR